MKVDPESWDYGDYGVSEKPYHPSVWGSKPDGGGISVGGWMLVGHCRVCGSPIFARQIEHASVYAQYPAAPQVRRTCECKP